MHQLNSNQGRIIAPIQCFGKRLFPQNDIYEYIKSQRLSVDRQKTKLFSSVLNGDEKVLAAISK